MPRLAGENGLPHLPIKFRRVLAGAHQFARVLANAFRESVTGILCEGVVHPLDAAARIRNHHRIDGRVQGQTLQADEFFRRLLFGDIVTDANQSADLAVVIAECHHVGAHGAGLAVGEANRVFQRVQRAALNHFHFGITEALGQCGRQQFCIRVANQFRRYPAINFCQRLIHDEKATGGILDKNIIRL